LALISLAVKEMWEAAVVAEIKSCDAKPWNQVLRRQAMESGQRWSSAKAQQARSRL